jgi:hypothetical protein
MAAASARRVLAAMRVKISKPGESVPIGWHVLALPSQGSIATPHARGFAGGIVLASGSAVGKKESAMTSKDNESDVPVSNWTLATGTKPFERHVYPPMIQSTPRQSATKERP